MSAAPAWYPSPAQELLLRAALLEPPAAEDAWVAWREAYGDDERSDMGSLRLLPLVYRNLAGQGSEDPWMGRLKGVYRRAWFLNQPLLRRAAERVAELEAAGIPTLVFKGAALAVLHYRDTGARPMDDVDVAVPPGREGEALQVLERAGVVPLVPAGASHRSVRHADTLITPDGHRIDLHWGLLWRGGPDDEFWSAAVPLDLLGTATRTLCPADHVVQVCGHGTHWGEVHPLRWAADVHTVIRSAPGGVDWDRLAAVARNGELTLALADALAYLRERIGTEVPDGVVESLRAHRVRRLRRAAHDAGGVPAPDRRPHETAIVYLDLYAAHARRRGARLGVLGFVDFVQHSVRVDSRRQLALHAARFLSRRFRLPRRGVSAAQRVGTFPPWPDDSTDASPR